MRDINRGELRAPARVVDIDLDRDYQDETLDVTRFATAWCLVRRHGIAAGVRFLDIADQSELKLAALQSQFSTTATTLKPVEPPDISLTVAICTRDRQEGLRNVLNSLAAQSDPNFEVLIVDNSSTGAVAGGSAEVDGLTVRYCHEPLPGLSRARNKGLQEVRTEFLAWIDDDELADPDWIFWIKQGFGSITRPDAVGGVMLPAELETEAQVAFERYGGFNKGRGMQPEHLRIGSPAILDPLFPLPNFGAGGNMAFRTGALRAIGGFDNRLGAGTLTHGGEETRALSLILETGATVLHWPPAVTWHYHRKTDGQLEEQFFGYAAGLTAYYMSLICTSPKYLWRIASFVPRGVKRILANRTAGGPDGPPADFPENLISAGRRGLYQGSWLYLRELRRQRRR